MRVALLAPEIPDYAIAYAKVVAARCDTLLLIADKHKAEERALAAPGLEAAWLPWPRQRALRNLSFIRALSRRLRQWRPDIVHFLNESNVWLNLLAPMLKPAAVVTTVHDIYTHPGDAGSARVPRLFANALVRRSDAVTVLGEGLRAEARNALPIAADRVFVTAHPPLTDYAARARRMGVTPPRDGAFRVLFFGRIYAYKGLSYLLAAAPEASARAPQVQFIIAGKGDALSAYDPHALALPNVRVENRFIPDDEAARLFAEADLLVLPYVEASQSGVLMMAMAFGLPAIVSDVGEMPAVARETGMGLVVPPRDAKALADAIVRIATNPALHAELSQAAVAACAGAYATGALTQQAENVYRQILTLKRS